MPRPPASEVPADSRDAQRALQLPHAHHRLDQRQQLGQLALGVRVKRAHIQRVQREHAPGSALDRQHDAHAVMHAQRLARPLDHQAVIRVGQAAVVVKTRDLAAPQDGGQARVLHQRKAASQRVGRQAVHRLGPQGLAAAVQAEQGHGPAAKVRAQQLGQALLTHRRRQLDRQVGQELGGNRFNGHKYLFTVIYTLY